MGYKELIERLKYYGTTYATGDNLGREIDGSDELILEAATAIETMLEERDAALRAQQNPAKLDRSRWDGCEYCNDPQPYKDCVLPDGTERILCALDDHPLPNCYINTRHIKFCPHCGRPITEAAWAELERRINGGTVD